MTSTYHANLRHLVHLAHLSQVDCQFGSRPKPFQNNNLQCHACLETPLVSHDQAAEVAQPGERPLHLPAPLITLELAAVLKLDPCAVASVRADQVDIPFEQQPLPKPVAVIRLVADQSPGL